MRHFFLHVLAAHVCKIIINISNMTAINSILYIKITSIGELEQFCKDHKDLVNTNTCYWEIFFVAIMMFSLFKDKKIIGLQLTNCIKWSPVDKTYRCIYLLHFILCELMNVQIKLLNLYNSLSLLFPLWPQFRKW